MVAAGCTDVVAEVNKALADLLPKLPAGVLTIRAGNGAEALGGFLFIDGRFADVGFGTVDVKEPAFAKVHDRLEDLVSKLALVNQVLADLRCAVLVNAVDNVAIKDDSEGLGVGNAGNPFVPKLNPLLPNAALLTGGLIAAAVIQFATGRRAKGRAATEVRVRTLIKEAVGVYSYHPAGF
jgi:hypothetical protein